MGSGVHNMKASQGRVNNGNVEKDREQERGRERKSRKAFNHLALIYHFVCKKIVDSRSSQHTVVMCNIVGS